MTDKTVLTDERIDEICLGIATWMFPVEHQRRDCDRAIGRAIERAVLASAGEQANAAVILHSEAMCTAFTRLYEAWINGDKDISVRWEAANNIRLNLRAAIAGKSSVANHSASTDQSIESEK